MPTRIININVHGNDHLFTLFEDEDMDISIYQSELDDVSIAGIVNGPTGVELGTWDRDGEWIQRWHERSDS